VVNLSSVGAHLDSGAGPISGLHDVEEILNDAADNMTHLRPGFFFENLIWQQDSMRQWGRISLPISGSRRYPMIASRDIGHVAAMRLASGDWSGRTVQELHGPADLSFDDVAGILSQILGRHIVYVQCSPQEMHQTLIETGMSENAADSLLEMYDAVETGKLHTIQPRSTQTNTPTTLAMFAQYILEPMFAQPVGR